MMAIERIQAAMVRAYPDSDIRKKIFNIMADSIELADEGVPGTSSTHS